VNSVERSLIGKPCGICDRPYRRNCYGGLLEYSDGSFMACPHWNMKLDEIGGMTSEEAEREEDYRRQFR
jgi:hypothetical protein